MVNLTKREREILTLLLTGKSNKEIASELYLSVHTIKTNLENIYEKFGIHNRVMLVVHLVKNNYL